jgi:hypothetical protein
VRGGVARLPGDDGKKNAEFSGVETVKVVFRPWRRVGER